MKFLKHEVTRLFALGFVAGTLAMGVLLDIGPGAKIAHEVVPAAVAAAPSR